MRILDKIAVFKNENGFFSKRNRLLSYGYKSIGSGDGGIMMGLYANEMYMDTETGEVLSAKDLMAEYAKNRFEIYTSSGAETFTQWIENCISPNGFLKRVVL